MLATFFDILSAVLFPAFAIWYVVKQARYDKGIFFLLIATNCEIGYWGARIVKLLEGMK